MLEIRTGAPGVEIRLRGDFNASRTPRTEYRVINMIFGPKPHQFAESRGKNDVGRQDILGFETIEPVKVQER